MMSRINSTQLFIVFLLILCVTAPAESTTRTQDFSTISQLREHIDAYNTFNSGSPLPPDLNNNRDITVFNMTSDISVESYHADNSSLTQVGNAVPFIRPFWPQEIIIEGNGHTLSRSSTAANRFRFLAVFGTVSSPELGNRTVRARVLIRNLTLSGFELNGFEGGALFVGKDAEVFLENVTFANNRVQPSSSSPNTPVKGGAIYVARLGGLELYASTLTDNSASYGGGIAVENARTTLRVQHSDISNNSAELGGGIYVTQSNFTVTDSNLSNNNGLNQGGGIYADFFNNGLVHRSTISDNEGGGIVTNGSLTSSGQALTNNLRVLTSTISGNSNSAGGAALHISNGETSIENSTITDNLGSSAILIAEWSPFDRSRSMTIRNSILTGNTSTQAEAGFSEIGCSQSGTSVALAFNLLGDSSGSQNDGISSDCVLSDISGASGTNLLAFSDGESATLIEDILKPLADNGCCLGESICKDRCSKKQKVGAPGRLICPMTHALSQGSPAIDVFRLFSVTDYAIDQRGVLAMPGPGEVSNYIDLGSYEGFIPDEVDCYTIKTKSDTVVTFCL